MTREEATIQALQGHIDALNETIENQDKVIKALEQEPCGDAISRQAVLDAIMANCIWENEYNLTSSSIKKAVESLPPVNPQPKTGNWILTDDDLVYCSECEDSYYARPIDASWYYCPHCGARME